MRGAEGLGVLELLGVDVDRDDRRGTGDDGARDGGVAHPAAADDRDGVSAPDVARVDGGAEAGHHPTAQEPDRRGVGIPIDLGALAGSDEGLLDERPDAERRAQLGAVGEGHLLGGVVGGEAIPGLALEAGAALAADGAPVEDDEVARCHLGDALAHGLDRAGRLVPLIPPSR